MTTLLMVDKKTAERNKPTVVYGDNAWGNRGTTDRLQNLVNWGNSQSWLEGWLGFIY